MKIAILGAGGTGLAYAALLADAEAWEEVTFTDPVAPHPVVYGEAVPAT